MSNQKTSQKLKTDLDRSLDKVFGKGRTGDFKMLVLILAISITVRAAIGLGPFSGQANTPEVAKDKEMAVPWGDFECHRMWIEITTNLNTTDWYEDTKWNNKTNCTKHNITKNNSSPPHTAS